MANQRSTNNEYNHYTQSKLLINNVPLSAHTNNYLIKLIIPLNKTGQLPGPANLSIDAFPISYQFSFLWSLVKSSQRCSLWSSLQELSRKLLNSVNYYDLLNNRSAYEEFFNRRSKDRKSTRLNSSHTVISYAVFCLKKKKTE